MTDTDTTTTTYTTRLPDGARACAACGIDAGRGGPTIVLDVMGREGDPPLRATSVGHITVSRCEACQARAAQADVIVTAHPGLVRRIGSPSVAINRVLGALDGAAAYAAVTGTRVHVPMTEPRDVTAALTHLLAPGVAARWSSWLSPVTVRGAGAGVCVIRPWAHLDDEHVEALRGGYADQLAARIARPGPIRCPSGGCLLCGVASVVGMPRTGVWRPVDGVPTGHLGGPSTGVASGHLCPSCARAADDVGAWGQTLAETALLRHLGTPRTLTPVVLTGVTAWAVSGRPPGDRPWVHVPGLDALVAELAQLTPMSGTDPTDGTDPTGRAAPRPRLPVGLLAEVARTRRMLNAVQSVPCATHDARPGQPCWTLPSTTTVGAEHIGVCADRLARARRTVFDPTAAAKRAARPR